MFERLLARFHRTPKDPSAPMEPPDAQHALATLLVRVAMADRAYLFEEVETIDRVLAHAFDLTPLAAARLRAEAEDTYRKLPGDVDLAHIIRDGVDYAHRLETVQALWAVAEADGVTVEAEAAIVDLVENEMGVAPTDNAAARAAASIP